MAYNPKSEHIDKHITYRHMKQTPAMEEYINKQLAKVENFLENERSPIYLHLVVDAEYTHHHHHVELQIKSPHYDLFVERESADMYEAIDAVIDVIYYQLREKKKEFNDKMQTGIKRE